MTSEEIEIKPKDAISNKIIDMFIENPETRDNVNLAIIMYWAKYDNDRFRQVLYDLGGHGIRQLTPASAIIWRMRHIQNKDERYQPSKEEKDLRKKAGENIRLRWGAGKKKE